MQSEWKSTLDMMREATMLQTVREKAFLQVEKSEVVLVMGKTKVRLFEEGSLGSSEGEK